MLGDVNLVQCNISVSYTHLDVYKRQIEGFTDGKEIIAQSELTIICLYPSLVLKFIKENKFKKGSIITDAVGIKSYFLEEAMTIIDPEVEFVSGHPMAGREKKGYGYASKEVRCV